MTNTAQKYLEQFRKLPEAEKDRQLRLLRAQLRHILMDKAREREESESAGKLDRGE